MKYKDHWDYLLEDNDMWLVFCRSFLLAVISLIIILVIVILMGKKC